MIIRFAYIPRERNRQIFNGHDADIVYSDRREIVLGSLPFGYVASLHHEIWQDHN